MDSLSYKTISANAATVNKEWVVIDATNEVLGRLASQIAKILCGKNKPSYTPHVDCGDYVIVVNAEKVKLTGKKLTDKVYVRHTGYPGGQRFATPADLLNRKPTAVIEEAVRGMLPKNRLGDAIIKGQAEAARMGIARALCEINPEYRAVLKKNGFLTRDSREVERKKPGQPGARRKFQFSKR